LFAGRGPFGQCGGLGNNLETMTLNRRNFIAASAALASAPALGAVSAPGETDVAIVGAGAAGIAAARKVAAAGRRFVLIEANDHVGGRCVTDTRIFGVPFDRGAHWLHMPDINPVAKLVSRSGLDLYPAPPGQKLRIEVYRRLARLRDLKKLDDFRQELRDRYGPPPEAVEWLLRTTEIRLLCVRWQIASIRRLANDLVFTYRNADRAKQLSAQSRGRAKVVDEKSIYLRLKSEDDDSPEGLYRLLRGVLNPQQNG